MELNSLVNTFAGGMNMDLDISNIRDNTYRYAENVRLLTDADGTSGTLLNIEYIRLYLYEGDLFIPGDETIIGTSNTLYFDKATSETDQCGIVLTKKEDSGKIFNTLYKVTGFKSIQTKSEVIVKGYLEIENNVSIVCNYESDKVSNVYISDGLTPIKVINIQDSYPNVVIDATRFDITPGCILLPFRFDEIINGSLPAGCILYCYQLFNVHGGETTTAALSEVIPLTKDAQAGSSKRIKGLMKGELTGKGCKITAKFVNDGRFDKARIFSIVYLDNNKVPDIYIVNEIDIPVNGLDMISFTYSDTGNSYVSKITIDEFNAMVPFEFNAKCIDKMANRLFVANTKELTWDIPEDYDTRAYRCDTYRNVKLGSSNDSEEITGTLNANGTISSNSGIIKVPYNHDCINPSNVQVTASDFVYSYAADGKTIGGTGEHISYKIMFAEIVPSSKIPSGDFYDDLELNNDQPVNKIVTINQNGSTRKIHALPQSIIPNYADAYVCSKFEGYQRGEIYRFGIIFYNNKNIPSPVHWIGDIKMPSVSTNSNAYLQPFHKDKAALCYNNLIKELVAYAMGLEFTVNVLPKGAVGYEIVRCDRTESDRTVVMQGALSSLISFDSWGGGGSHYHFGNNDIRPMPFLTLTKGYNTYYRHADKPDINHMGTEANYYEFVSPEICVSRGSTLELLQQSKIAQLYKINTNINRSNGNRMCVAQSEIYSVNAQTLVKGDPEFGKLRVENGLITFDGGYGHKHGEYNGQTGLFRYYDWRSLDTMDYGAHNIEDAIITNVLPYQITLTDTKNYAQFIGSKAYINTSIGGWEQFSNHGISGIIKTDSTFDPRMNESVTNVNLINSMNTAVLCNIVRDIIPYGGNTYISRQSSVYKSCGAASLREGSIECFGGDTFLGVLDYQNTSVIQLSNDPGVERESRICSVCYIPVETSINLNLRSDESYSRTTNGLLGLNLIQNDITAFGTGYAQKLPLYVYNSVYSVQNGSKNYIPRNVYFEDNAINGNRIVCSEAKTNNELTDSWCKFKFANYIDVDTQHGPITNIKNFKNKLFYWQDSAVGIAAVNERSLILDGNMAELTLGTGGILTRFDYITESNGSSIVNDKSIIASPTTMYWYDFDKNEICALNGNSVLPLSKAKGVLTYLNQLPASAKTNPVSFFDHKYKEVWFRIYDRALIYNEQLGVFTSFYTHNPNWFFPFSDKLVTIKDNNMYYLHNIYEVNSEAKEERLAKIEFVVNKDYASTKVFDNVAFSAKLLDVNSEVPKIVKDVIFKTKTLETNPIDYNSIELREDNYRFAILREKAKDEKLQLVVSKSFLSRMRGKYLICDYTFDCNDNREFRLPFIKTTYRYSML